MDPIVCITMDSELAGVQRDVVEDIVRAFQKVERLLHHGHVASKDLIQSKLVVIAYLLRSYSIPNKTGLANTCNSYIASFNRLYDSSILLVEVPPKHAFTCFAC